MHWKKLSPDLGYPKGQTPPPPSAAGAGRGGRGGASGPAGGSIESMSASTVGAGIIWVGTNNGLVRLTKDHGLTIAAIPQASPALPVPVCAAARRPIT